MSAPSHSNKSRSYWSSLVNVDGAAAVLAEQLVIDETRDVVYWQAPGAEPRQTGLHDYGALYAVSGLYEAVYLVRLGVRSPQLLAEVLASVCPSVRRAQLQVLDVGAGTGCVGAALNAAGFQRIAGTDLEPAGITAIGRDRGNIYTGAPGDRPDSTNPRRPRLAHPARPRRRHRRRRDRLGPPTGSGTAHTDPAPAPRRPTGCNPEPGLCDRARTHRLRRAVHRGRLPGTSPPRRSAPMDRAGLPAQCDRTGP